MICVSAGAKGVAGQPRFVSRRRALPSLPSLGWAHPPPLMITRFARNCCPSAESAVQPSFSRCSAVMDTPVTTRTCRAVNCRRSASSTLEACELTGYTRPASSCRSRSPRCSQNGFPVPLCRSETAHPPRTPHFPDSAAHPCSSGCSGRCPSRGFFCQRDPFFPLP